MRAGGRSAWETGAIARRSAARARAAGQTRRTGLAGVVLAVSLSVAASAAAADRVLVFAAASLKNALEEISVGFEAQSGVEVVLSLAGSSVLARQIQLGAPADVFISAHPQWMDVLADEGLIQADARTELLSNRLALIAPRAAKIAGPFDLAADLPRLLGDGRLAMALVDAVPAGVYGKAALQSVGVWDAVAARVAQTDNVRAALALVARGEAPLGVVYASDAVAEEAVRVVALFHPETHPPIRYPVGAVVGGDAAAARALIDHLRSAEAGAAFRRHGFGVLAD